MRFERRALSNCGKSPKTQAMKRFTCYLSGSDTYLVIPINAVKWQRAMLPCTD